MRAGKKVPVPRASELKPVVVEWIDAALDPDYDGPPDGVMPGTVVNRTIGFLLRSNRTEVVVVRDVSPHENTVRWPYAIPRKMVKSVVYLTESPDATKER